MFIIPIICVGIEYHKRKSGFISILCKWFVFWSIGVRATTTGIMQFANPTYTMALLQLEETSKIIIQELGYAQFGIGIVALLTLVNKSYMGAAAISYGAFMCGASLIHISRISTAEFDEMMSLVGDILVIIIAITYFISRLSTKKTK